MKNPLLKKALPHLIAVAIFVLAGVLFCKPVLDGNVLSQDDIVRWKGVAQSAFEYKEKNGHLPLWNANLFSGMPNYQIAMEGKSVMPDMVKILSLGLPKPMNFFFLACICFYILCMALRIRPVVAMFGALAFAYSTYDAVVINAGHDTQMLATAFMPLLMAGLIFTFEKKYWLGFALTTYAAYQQLGVNHLQISYYFFLIATAVTLAYLYTWIRNKDWKHILITGAIVVTGALIGLAGNALTLMTTSEYAKYTMRGGKDIDIKGDAVTAAKTSGLDTAYAFEYSLGKAESFTLLMPNAFGGDSRKTLDENSSLVKKLVARGADEGNAQSVAQQIPKYWGALPFTAGPAYLGVFIFILGLIGFVIIKTPLRWGLLAVTLLGVILSWGKNLAGFNTFLFEHLPMYNKFRAPSMAQVIPQFTMTLIAVLTLHHLLFREKSRELLKADFKKILYVVGGLFAFLAIMYVTMDYRTAMDSYISSGVSGMFKNDDMGRAAIAGLKADRMAMFGGQLLRAAGFAIVLLGLLYVYMRGTLKSSLLVAILLLAIGSIELLATSKAYLGEESYTTPDEITSTNFTANNIEQQILQDKDPAFRVYNTGASLLTDARTPYFFKSITGYHPARLRIYQDLLDKYFQSNPNPEILNMLNVKYFIVQNPQSNQQAVIPNPDAYGPCWFVKNVQLVDGRVPEIIAIGKTNLKDTAIVDKAFSNIIIQPAPDSTSSIRLTKFDNDAMEYEANCTGPQFAVFSEIYYPKGWNAYIDDKKTEYCSVDYVLRGLSVPAGKHKIKFAFEPASVKTGTKLMYIASILIIIILLGGLFMQWRSDKKASVVKA